MVNFFKTEIKALGKIVDLEIWVKLVSLPYRQAQKKGQPSGQFSNFFAESQPHKKAHLRQSLVGYVVSPRIELGSKV